MMEQNGSSASQNGGVEELTEKQRSVLQSLEQARQLNEKRNGDFKNIVDSGQAINPKAALARCFSSGSHGNEELRGGA